MSLAERAQALRDNADRHYNCCQSVFLPFAERAGMDHETAARVAAVFGSGMNRGATCGAVTGALMVLGMLGYDEKQATALLRKVREGHGALDCATLLRTSNEAGIPRKQHCDGIVFELLQAVEECRTLASA